MKDDFKIEIVDHMCLIQPYVLDKEKEETIKKGMEAIKKLRKKYGLKIKLK